ncbi:hypothetical protein CP979_19395 [Streptomyces filamentosus]|nr:hypothetical protein CP979_19395 [Streptomyces filamentosus]
MTASTSYSNLPTTVTAVASSSSSTVLTECFPWLVPSLQSLPQVEVRVSGVAPESDGLADEFAAYAAVSDEWAAATWEATAETWPEY